MLPRRASRRRGSLCRSLGAARFAGVPRRLDDAGTCSGHRADDLLPFVGLTPDQDKLYTNEEFYWATGPDSPALTYVYNSVAYWPGCTGGTMNVSSPTGGRRR